MVAYENKKKTLEFMSINKLAENFLHCHKEFEIVVCFRGKIKVFVNEKEYILTAGDMIFLFPYQIHSYENIEKGKFKLMVFSTEYIPGIKNMVGKNNFIHFASYKEICDIINLLDKKYELNDPNFKFVLTGCLNLLVYELITLLEIHEDDMSFGSVQKIVNYCVENCEKKISLGIVSKELNLPSEKISKILVHDFGLTFPQFINTLRIANACALLKNLDLNIAQIAFAVGFDSVRNFNRSFLRIMNESPSDYRAKITNKQRTKKEHIT